MRPTDRTRGNHPGIIDYKGKTYVFGQNYDLLRLEMEEHHERRSISVAEMHYNADGTIQEVPYFKDVKVEQIEHFDPYRRVEAETMAWGYGLKTEKMPDGGIYVTAVDDGDSLIVREAGRQTFPCLHRCGARLYRRDTFGLCRRTVGGHAGGESHRRHAGV